MVSLAIARQFLAPSGTLRVAINLSNVLLVSSRSPVKGLAPNFAKAVATHLKLENLQLVPYDHPNLICDDATSDNWDLALIGADPMRSEHISFTRPYCEIRATLMIRAEGGGTITELADVDKPGKKIMTKKGGAYDLWLRQNLKHAELLSATTLDESYESFKNDVSIDALAGLRSKLTEDLSNDSEKDRYTILDSNFMSVQQAVGVRRKNSSCSTDAEQLAEFLNTFIDSSLQEGAIARLIQEHELDGKLFPARL